MSAQPVREWHAHLRVRRCSPAGRQAGELVVPCHDLITLSINSFPDLLDFRDNILTPEERLLSDDPNWQSPWTGTVNEQYEAVPVRTAWIARRLWYKQRTVDQSRQRKTGTRRAANAADTAIAATQTSRRSALSLATITDQPTSQPTGRSSPSRIVEILHEGDRTYKVRWSQPVGNPEQSDERTSWLDNQGDYKHVRRVGVKLTEVVQVARTVVVGGDGCECGHGCGYERCGRYGCCFVDCGGGGEEWVRSG